MIVLRRRRPRTGGALVLALGAACAAGDQGGECATDDDCPGADAFCLFDEPRGTTFCSTTCADDLGCPPTAACREVETEPEGDEASVCLARVRSCGGEELCNGLDDDCNGAIDDECTDLVCRNETQCGAFSCAAPEGVESARCRARPEGAPRRFWGPCLDGDDCPNGICEAGLCTPICQVIRSGDQQFERPDCLSPFEFDFDDDGSEETRSSVCAEQVGPTPGPPHNACQVLCDEPADCPGDLECVWRRIWPFEDIHRLVCSEPDPSRSPLGADCPNNFVEGDATCQSGLCFDFKCTRPCAGAGDACSDVDEDFACQRIELSYDDIGNPAPPETFLLDICALP